MNTLKSSWDCPMVAYGPGDSSLDHTDKEHILINDFSLGYEVLKTAVLNWVNLTNENGESK